jgi:phage repressor protein C with HTH and peptisase S24 domain
MNGNEKYLSDSLFQKICTAFPALNEEWLKTGEGEMLKVPATLTVFSPTDEERREIGEGVDIKAYPAEVVEEIREEIKAEIEEAESVLFVSSKVANDATINVRKYIEKRGDEMERIKPSDLVAEADIAERIRKGSMMPTFMPGDIVFVRFLDDKKIISDGHTYYFDLKDRPTIIRKVKFDGEKLRLIAENPTFGDIITSFADIENVADIVGMFRSSFSNQYAEIEAVRRKKDEQIDNLLLQNGGLIEQNGEALKIIRDLMKK